MTSAGDVRAVDVRGQEIFYRREGTGPTAVIFPTLGFGGRWWPLYDELAEHFDVVVPDLPGFGSSPQAEWMRTLDDLVLYMAEFFDALGLGQVTLVGHSFGAWVAAEFAAFFPERLTSLVLVTPMGVRVQGEPVADLFRMTPEGRLNVMLNGDLDAFTGDSEVDRIDAILQDFHDLTGYGRFAWNPRYDIQLDRRLGRVQVPALVVGVDDDRTVPASHAARFVELLPRATALTISGDTTPTSHGVVVQQPTALARAILTFTEGAQ